MTTRGRDGGDDTDAASLARRLAAFIREQAPVAYCDQCLAVHFGEPFSTVRAAVLLVARDQTFSRRLRHCYRCGSTVELTSLG
ncbi:MAG TPA: hypothetical protein VGU22_16170 [Methylomirabilota bacterium]|nr:hypothetical protein [Methylomirabilota bacterium]